MTPTAGGGRRRPTTRRHGRSLVVVLGLTALAGCSPSTLASPAPDVTTVPTTSPTRAGPTATAHPSAPSPTSEPVAPPPYVSSVRWVTTSSGRSLQVRPTAAGRTTTASYPEAWAEVLRLAPGADSPGMRAQFSCHWTYARALAPDKPSWNLEPWRPVVSTSAMLSAGCNPGGGEE